MGSSFVTAVALVTLALVPADAQTTLNASQDLVRLGIAAANLTPNQPALDAVPLLIAAVNYAKAHSVTLLTVDRGTYYFLGNQFPVVQLTLPQIDGMTVDFQGSDLVFNSQLVGGIWLQQSRNAVLQNFTVDFAKLPFTQLRVTSVDPVARQIQYAPLAGWSDATVFNSINASSLAGGGFYFFVFRNGHPAPDLSRMQATAPFTATRFNVTNDNLPWTTSDFLARIHAGDTIVFTARGGGDPVRADGCDGCALRNIRIYSAGGWGFQVVNSQNTTVDHVYAMPKPGTDRLISTNADGITLAQPGPNNVYRLNRSIRTLDDGLSPHSLVLGTVTGQAARQIQLQRQFNLNVTTGSEVAFESATDGSILGKAAIVSQTPPAPVSSGESVTIVFDRDLPANLTGAVVYTTDSNQRGGNTLVERNAVEDQVFARGITLWGLMNSTVRGNYIWRSGMDAILGTHRMVSTDWMSPPLVNLALTNNVIDEPAALFGGSESNGAITIEGAGQPSFGRLNGAPNNTIQIAGNLVADAGLSAIRVESTTNASITGNTLVNSNSAPCVNGKPFNTYVPCDAAYQQAVFTLNSPAPSGSNNTVDRTSTRAYVTDKTYARLAAYARGTTVRLNAYNVGAGSAPAVTLTDADGKSSPLTVQATAAHSIDVQLPAGIAPGGAWIAIAGGGQTRIATLFVDDVDNIAAVNGCAYWVGPAVAAIPSGGGKIQALVVTQDGCAWTASSRSDFATLTASGAGTAVVEATVAANTDLARTAVLEIAGYQTALVQSGVVNYASFASATASASLDSARTPDKAVDGNIQTLWSSGAAPPGWIEIALPPNAVVGSLRFTVRVGNANTAQTIRISARHADGSLTQVKQFTMTNNDFDVVPVSLDAPVTGATAIRIDTLTQVPAGFPAWREIEILSALGPAITSVNSVTGSGPTIAPNTWIEIHGASLSSTTRLWDGSDFLNGLMPTKLDGVSVLVNGKPAFVEYVSPAQVNVLAPLDSTLGPVQVQLTNGSAAAAAFPVQEQSVAPGFFVFGGGPYIAATHADGSYLGPTTLYPGATTPAKPGEVIVLYANGFGQTSPPVVNGAPTQSGNLPALPIVTIGGVQAVVQFAGVVTPGLYQINVVVPASLADGDATVSASYGGSTTQTGLAVAVKR